MRVRLFLHDPVDVAQVFVGDVVDIYDFRMYDMVQELEPILASVMVIQKRKKLSQNKVEPASKSDTA